MLWCAQGNDRIRESGRSEPGAFAEPETIGKFRTWFANPQLRCREGRMRQSGRRCKRMSYRGQKHNAYVSEMERQSAALGEPVERGNRTGARHAMYSHGVYKQRERARSEKYMRSVANVTAKTEALLAQAEELHAQAVRMARWSIEDSRTLLREESAMRRKAEGLTCRRRARRIATYSRSPERGVSPTSTPASLQTRVERHRDPIAEALAQRLEKAERNFMDGISYRVNPVDTLKMISASSVFGEPQYYRDGDHAPGGLACELYCAHAIPSWSGVGELERFRGLNTARVMEKAIDEALSEDFGATLDWALELRTQYQMRLNPQVIVVRAAEHPGREAFTKANPGVFGRIAEAVMQRGDDVTTQIGYRLAKYDGKRGIPAVLKRAWARRIGGMDAYTMAKYGNAGIGLVDAVRICHAKGKLVDELMRNGRVAMPEGENTWERLRSSGMKWEAILSGIRMPHMALLRNLRGIFSEVQDFDVRERVLEQLLRGVRKGRQFPFRYLSAWRAVEDEGRPWSRQVQHALEQCMNIACESLPKLPGRCAFLSDNSGSAWGACTSEWGTMQVAEIGNLSSVIGAMRADEGVVFPFGDRLSAVPIHKDEGVLAQSRRVSDVGSNCGKATENGIWLFFRDAIMEQQKWDSIFIYSDMQAGHGHLYGIHPEDYEVLGCRCDGHYIDVNMLVQLYRKHVNPKVNVYCIQTAGYTNAVVPEYGYRSAILYGWTGKELLFADAMRRTWDEMESRQQSDG